jgi:hypothetical protein
MFAVSQPPAMDIFNYYQAVDMAKALHYCDTLEDLRERTAAKNGTVEASEETAPVPVSDDNCGGTAADEVESDRSTESGGEEVPEVHSEPEDDDCRGGTSPRPVSSSDALFIFDWDDTLFPTSWLQREGIHVDGSGFRSQRQKAQFRKVARTASALLAAAKKLGKVIVVTNAEAGWIEQCTTHLLPELAPAIEGVQLVSARSQFIGHAEAACPSEWKLQAFDREIQAFCAGRAGTASSMQVFSLGDSLYEQTALFRVAKAMPAVFRPKSVKLMEQPSVAQLAEQHELLALNLEDLFEQEGEFDIEVGSDQGAQ